MHLVRVLYCARRADLLRVHLLEAGMTDMTPEEFKKWRKSKGLTQQEAAEELGISVSAIGYYEHGTRRGDDEPAIIPRAIELACSSIDKQAVVKMKIREKITSNGKGGITGAMLQEVLLDIVDAMPNAAASTLEKRRKVKDRIEGSISPNGRGAITGALMQQVLLEIVDAI